MNNSAAHGSASDSSERDDLELLPRSSGYSADCVDTIDQHRKRRMFVRRTRTVWSPRRSEAQHCDAQSIAASKWKHVAAWQMRGSTCIRYTPRDSIPVVSVRAISGSPISVEDASS